MPSLARAGLGPARPEGQGTLMPSPPLENKGLALRGAHEGAEKAQIAPHSDLHLAKLIDAWPDLSKPVRAGILAMVHASDNGKEA